jgi:hypothetical protein
VEHKQEEFQCWTLTVKDRKGILKGDDGNGNVFATQDIPFTDFPLEEIKLYCMLGSLDGVNPVWILLLPGEY